jgi:uncharacterized protein
MNTISLKSKRLFRTPLQEEIKNLVRREMESSPASHGWDHVKRVHDLCLKIGKKERADLTVLGLAALLHDIGRKEEQASKGKICHARVGAEKAEKILVGLGVPKQVQKEVLACIRSHRFRGKEAPSSLEAKILFDADKLDSIGAVGVGRAFLFAGEVGARLHNSHKDLSQTVSYSREDTAFREFQVKLIKVRDRMLTASGKALAEGRHRFMVRFFERLDAEVKGLR